MKLTLTLNLLIAKAQGNLFDTSHLHQELRVDRRGRKSTRWVRNQEPAAPQRPKGITEAQGDLFSQPAPQKPPQTVNAQKQGGLFDAPAPEGKQGSLFEQLQRSVEQARANKTPKKTTRAAPEGLGDLFSQPAPQAPKKETKPALAPNGPKIGDTKVEAGVTYRLNENHRWERVDQERPDYTGRFTDTTLPQFGFELLPRTTLTSRKNANQEAQDVAHRLEAEGRLATPEERQKLAKFTGEGGLDTGDLNAHYTPTVMAAAMWKILTRAGFKGGDVLEPSMGAGVFMETAPHGANMTGVELNPTTSLVAKHLHPHADVQGNMPFERWHKNNPDRKFDAVISNPPYGARGVAWLEEDKPELRNAEDYFIDTGLDHLKDGGLGAWLVNAGPLERESEAARMFRARMLARAEVIGTYQLPDGTFEESGSGVPPVMIVLRKRPHEVGMTLARLVEQNGEEALRHAGVHHEAFLSGTLHLQPENMVGEFTGKTTFKGYKDIRGEITAETLSKLTDEASHLSDGLVTIEDLHGKLDPIYGADPIDSALQYAKNYGLPRESDISPDGSRIFLSGRWKAISEQLPALDAAWTISRLLRDMAHIRNNGDRATAEPIREEALKRVQEFMGAYGNPHDHKAIKDAARHHKFLANLLTAVSPDGTIASHLTQSLHHEQLGKDLLNPTDPLAVSHYLAGKGKLNPTNLAGLWSGADGNADRAEDFLLKSPDIALTEDGKYIPAEEYYYGNVYERADSLQAAAEKEKNPRIKEKLLSQAQAFRDMKPRKSLEDFEVKPNAKWINPKIIEDFLNEVIDENGTWQVRHKDGVFYVSNLHHWVRAGDAVEEFKKYLNHAITPDAVREQKNKDAAEIKAERKANIERAKARMTTIENQFSNWLSESDHRDQVEDTYNQLFNSYLPPHLDTAPLDTEKEADWNSKLQPHPYQRQAVRFALQQGGGLIALDVGLGKTMTGILLARELKRTGQAKKPMVVVPNGLLSNWRKTYEKSHTDADVITGIHDQGTGKKRRILVIGQTAVTDKKTGEVRYRDDDGTDVAQKLVRVANEDWDSVIITRDWHSRIPLSSGTWMDMVMSDAQKRRDFELDESDSPAYKGASRKKGKGSKSKRDQESENAKKLEDAVNKLFKNRNDALHYEDLGIDAMICDEAHAYKNLYSAPSELGEQPRFMGAGAESKTAQDFNYKSRHMRTKTGGRNVFFLTATPTKNSPLEVYNMLSHITDAFEKRGINLTEDFVSRYCQIEPRMIPTLDGGLETKPAVVGFKNLSELRGLLDQYVFRRDASSEDIQALPGWHVPDREDIQHEFDLDDDSQSMYDSLARGAKEAVSTYGGRAEGGKHVFSYLSDMRKVTLDPHLMGLQMPVVPRFKKAAEIAKAALDKGGKVVGFMDIGQQKGDGKDELAEMDPESLNKLAESYKLPTHGTRKELEGRIRSYEDSMSSNAYERLVDHLVKEGIPRDQIAVVTGATTTKEARTQIKERFNAGELKVVIGSTKTIGEGFSLQRGTTDMIHFDTPWDPGTYQQRLGRAQRQGNTEKVVKNHILLASGSFDPITYTTMLGKKGWMDQLWHSTADRAENSEAASADFEQIAAMLSSDPSRYRELLEKRKAEMEASSAAAAQAMTIDQVKGLARKRSALHSGQKRVAELTQDIQKKQDVLSALPEDRQEKARQVLSERQGQLVKAQTQLARAQRDHDGLKKRLLEDPHLAERHKPLVEGDMPFMLDDNGGFYTPGGTFKTGNQLHRVTEINHAKQQISVSPLIPTRQNAHHMRTWDISDLKQTQFHTADVADEDFEPSITDHIRNGGTAVLKQFHPERGEKHKKAIHRALMEAKPYGAWVVPESGKPEYRSSPAGITPEMGERYLLPTSSDLELYRQHYPKGINDTTKARSLPFQTRSTMERGNYSPTYHIDDNAYQGGTNLIKAPQKSLVGLYHELRRRHER